MTRLACPNCAKMFKLFQDFSFKDFFSSCFKSKRTGKCEKNRDDYTEIEPKQKAGSQVYTQEPRRIVHDVTGAKGVHDSSSESDAEDVQEKYKEAVKRSASFLIPKTSSAGDDAVANEADIETGLQEDLSTSLLGDNLKTEKAIIHSSDDSGHMTADIEVTIPAKLLPESSSSFDNQAYDVNECGTGGTIVPSASDSDQGIELKNLDGDPNFDVSDLHNEAHIISKCGSINMTFLYSASKSIVTVSVHSAKDVPAKERGGADSSQVRLMLLPHKKQKFKTRIKTGVNPVFEEVFFLSKVKLDDLSNMGLRIRLYAVERMRRQRLIGECLFAFNYLILEQPVRQWLNLEPRSNLTSGDTDTFSLQSDGGSSQQSMQHGGMPELLTGLTYTSTTGRLSCEVIKGSNFRNMAMTRPPDTYVKLTMMSATGHELYRSKTSVRRGQPNPLFKEMFMFQIAKFQLHEVTLLVSVYCKRSMKKKDMIGWFSLGRNSSGEEEQAHWTEMCENQGQQICRWHILVES